jgi:3',5'-cyclic AMP phosphodiesterase CpdA
MRLQIFSDLHFDVRLPEPITVAPCIDAVIVTGDTCEGAERGFEFLRGIVPMQVPIVFVLGNHELYRRAWSEELVQARAVAPLYGAGLLENDVAIIDNVRFIGATLWTDYALFGAPLAPLAMRRAAAGLNDHRLIGWSRAPWQRFRPQEALMLHRQSRAFIEATLAQPFDGATVVATHHAPHPRSVHPRFVEDLLSAAFASDLTAVIEAGRPELWVHGHVHHSCDYQAANTRIICNPHGYGGENPDFDPALIVEVG